MKALKLLLAAFVLILVLKFGPRATAEDLAWMIHYDYLLDPALGFVPIPGRSYDWTDPFGNREKARINSAGYRGDEIAKTKDRPRVVLLGSSMVYGYGVADPETMSAHLSDLLQKQNLKAEVINAGMKMTSLDQSYKFLLTKILPLKPDFVVWFLTAENFSNENEIQLELYDYDAAADKLAPREVRRTFYYRSSELLSRISGNKSNWGADTLYTFVNEIATWSQSRFQGNRLESKFGKFTRELRELSSREGIRFTVMILPDREHRTDFTFLTKVSALPISDLNRDPALERNGDSLFLKNDKHLSSFGNGKVAQRVYEWILQAGLQGPRI